MESGAIFPKFFFFYHFGGALGLGLTCLGLEPALHMRISQIRGTGLPSSVLCRRSIEIEDAAEIM